MDKQERKRLLKVFVVRAVALYALWLVVYYGFIQPEGSLNAWLTNLVIQGTVIGLDLLGYETSGEGSLIYIDNQPVVLVADACNGLELFALYAGFLLCFPGPIRYKAFFIPIGIGVVFLVNVLREIVLSLNYKFFQQTFEFNHKYTYVFVVYGVVFLIWRYWLNRYSAIAKN
ncbi:exosortase X [Marinoscillum furvescens]|uniref:Exosortase/archaeosortase family protein n=1 Tax=Marinoscillum furvescens DSM 4134 TaxID=1122208 RepID=A0A3D9L7Y7_MARFU|nr:archaeosortase/exosortase family protein [Marinoscillum furvescens]REE01623.1 exosortase/archaeosortase family protein [Marinoscillum furvescens DSM 4134]